MISEHLVDIDAPPERAYETLADIDRWPEFMSALERAREVAGDADEKRVEMHERSGRLKDAAVYRVRFEAPLGMRAVQECGLLRTCDVMWTFWRRGDGTRLSVIHRYACGWPVVGGLVDRWLLGPWVVDRIVDRTVANFKALVETGRSPKQTSAVSCGARQTTEARSTRSLHGRSDMGLGTLDLGLRTPRRGT